jgi:hypothetical protein
MMDNDWWREQDEDGEWVREWEDLDHPEEDDDPEDLDDGVFSPTAD